jgi:hypothetical protein
MYKLKSVITAANTINTVANPIPALANASGNESTPPPTIVATRLNVPKNKVVFRRGELEDGFISSRDALRVKTVKSSSPVLASRGAMAANTL